MKIMVYGANGRMGKEIIAQIEQSDSLTLAAAVDKSFTETDKTHLASLPDAKIDADVLIDFSNHACIYEISDYAKKTGTPTVIATTGQTAEESAKITALSSVVPVFFSANMSVGIALLTELAKKCAATFPSADIEIIEKHHSAKLDAPSGTALMIANAINRIRENAVLIFGRNGRHVREKNEIGVHSVRAGSIVGEHEVIVATKSEIITVKHEAQSRTVFADGALSAAEWLCGKPKGLYTMSNIFSD